MNKNAKIIITILCVLFGFFISNDFGFSRVDSQIGGVASAQQIEELLNQINELEKQKEQYLIEIREKEALIKYHEESILSLEQTDVEVSAQMMKARVLAGLTDVIGPGIRITMDDRPRSKIEWDEEFDLSSFIVHDTDLLSVVNELRSAGAEAIEINGVRILSSSRISCGGPTINVGREARFAPPFIINAIGNPDDLLAQFQTSDSIYNVLTSFGLEFRIEKQTELLISRYFGSMDLVFANPF